MSQIPSTSSSSFTTQSNNQSNKQSINQSNNQTASLAANAAAIRVGVAITVIREQPEHQSNNQSNNQTIDQSNNQSNNRSKYEFLLIKRGKAPMMNHWALPGGSIEAGETIIQSARRELYEECQIDCDMIEPFYSTDVILSTNQSVHKAYHFVLIHVLAARLSINQQKSIKASDDAIDAKWFTRQEIEDMHMATEQSNNQSIDQPNNQSNNQSNNVESIVPRVGEVVDRAVLLYDRTYHSNQ